MTHLVLNANSADLRDVLHRGITRIRDTFLGDVHEHIAGMRGFIAAILRRPLADITKLDVHSHGAPGMAIAPADDDDLPLQDGLLEWLSKGGPLASRFAADACIEFDGCNVAGRTRTGGKTDMFASVVTWDFENSAFKNAKAEKFIGELAQVLLAERGGTLLAYTGYGLDGVGHTDGEPVMACVEPGGRSTFRFAVELDAVRLRREISEARTLLSGAIGLRQAVGGPATTSGETSARQLLDHAEHWIGDGRTPTCQEAYLAFSAYTRGACQAWQETSGAFGRMLP